MDRKEEIGQLIRTMRLSRNMTQADLAKKIAQSQSSITMYETGRREPDFETMEALADAFNVPLQSLFPNDSEQHQGEPVYLKHGEVRIMAKGFDRMPEEKRKKAFDLAKMIFSEYAEYFEEGTDDDEKT